MPVSTPGAQLAPGSQLVDWFLFRTVPYWLICRYVRAIDYVIVQSVDKQSENYYPGPVENLKFFDDKHKKSPCSPSVPNLFPQMQEPLPSVPSKRSNLVWFLCECIMNLLKRKPQCMRTIMCLNFDAKFGFFLKRTTWKQKRDVLACKKACN